MPATNLQMAQLAGATDFQAKVRSSIYKKALAILEDALANGTIEAPKQGQTPHYAAAQVTRATSIGRGQSLDGYYGLMACSTNVIASAISVDGGGQTVSDISDAALDSQVYTVVFNDVV